MQTRCSQSSATLCIEFEKHPLQREERFFFNYYYSCSWVDFGSNSHGGSPAMIPGWPSWTVTGVHTEPNAGKLHKSACFQPSCFTLLYKTHTVTQLTSINVSKGMFWFQQRLRFGSFIRVFLYFMVARHSKSVVFFCLSWAQLYFCLIFMIHICPALWVTSMVYNPVAMSTHTYKHAWQKTFSVLMWLFDPVFVVDCF